MTRAADWAPTPTSSSRASGACRPASWPGLETIPAYIRKADDQQMLEMALIENIQRENLNAIEIALSYQRLLSECDLRQEDLGDRVGKNRSTVTNYLRLLKLPPDIQIGLRDADDQHGPRPRPHQHRGPAAAGGLVPPHRGRGSIGAPR
ncbi:MAG: ParB/RepB/Spo0J family partition protein [Hymenobacter sp.]